MSEITVRLATLEDAEFIAEGNTRMALETEGRRLDPAILRGGVHAVFNDPARGFYLIAELDGQPAGQMMISHGRCGSRLEPTNSYGETTSTRPVWRRPSRPVI